MVDYVVMRGDEMIFQKIEVIETICIYVDIGMEVLCILNCKKDHK
jgi:hypothetical protein